MSRWEKSVTEKDERVSNEEDGKANLLVSTDFGVILPHQKSDNDVLRKDDQMLSWDAKGDLVMQTIAAVMQEYDNLECYLMKGLHQGKTNTL